jgi:SAM-dependent methyltransferase
MLSSLQLLERSAFMPEAMLDFNAMVRVYERLAEPLTGQVCQRAAMLSGVRNGDRVIDVATGTGALALSVATEGARVLATDIAPADAEDENFDTAFSIFGVMLFAAWRESLAELVRVVRPNGSVVVAAWPDRVGAKPMVVLNDVFCRVFPDRSLSAGIDMKEWSETSLHCAMIESGCSDATVAVCEAIQSAPSVDALTEQFDPLFRFAPGNGALSDEERARLMPPLKAAFQAYALADGSCRLPSSALIAVGRKPG